MLTALSVVAGRSDLTFPGFTSGSDSNEKRRRGEFFGLRVISNVSAIISNIHVVRVVLKLFYYN